MRYARNEEEQTSQHFTVDISSYPHQHWNLFFFLPSKKRLYAIEKSEMTRISYFQNAGDDFTQQSSVQ